MAIGQLTPSLSHNCNLWCEEGEGVSWLLKTDPGRQRGSPSSAGQRQLNSIMAAGDNFIDHSLFVLLVWFGLVYDYGL